MLISPQYRKILEKAHEETSWATTGQMYASLTYKLAQDCQSILDFGAGKQSLAKAINKIDPRKPVFGYDPAIPEISKLPEGMIL